MNDAIVTDDTSATTGIRIENWDATVDAEERTFWYTPTQDDEFPTSSPVSYDGNIWWNDDWRYCDEADDNDEGHVKGTALVITGVILLVIFVVASMVRHNMRTDNSGSNRRSNVNNNTIRQTTARLLLGAFPHATAPAEEKPVDPELRAKIVKAIFPEQKVDDSDLHYDEEAQSLRWIDNNNRDVNSNKNLNTTCSICLDKFAEGDLIISSLCSHIYHRECVMEWAQTKDDCPMCRQKMWDEDTYDLLEENIKRLGKNCAVGN